jgi:parallel beta-helix repeat protein
MIRTEMRNENAFRYHILTGLIIIAIMCTNCDGTDDGLVGITFKNGTECLGEEAQSVEGDIVYVSPEGDDQNAGTTGLAPLRTLALALCNLRPGQTLNILPGTYRESIVMGDFGNEESPILIQGVAVGDQLPVLEGDGIRTMGLALIESTNIVVENLEFRNYSDEGLFILLGSEITIRGNRFIANGIASIDADADGEGFGIRVEGTSEILIESNEATENGPSRDRVQQGILGTGIDTYQLDGAIIRDNHAHENMGGGILVEDGINVLVVDNQVDHNELDAGGDYWDGGIWVDGGHDITLRGNLIVDNHGPGIQISDEDQQYPQASHGYLVEGNEIVGNVFGIYIWNFGHCPYPNQEIINFLDNTIQRNLEKDVWCLE